jgi:hypothetical protein
VVYVLVGAIVLLDRLGYIRIPFLKRPSGTVKRKGMAKTPPKKKKKKRKRA